MIDEPLGEGAWLIWFADMLMGITRTEEAAVTYRDRLIRSPRLNYPAEYLTIAFMNWAEDVSYK